MNTDISSQSGIQTWPAWLASHQFADLFDINSTLFAPHTWHPTAADQKAAWAMYTELRTRITTQKLAYRAGDEATALNSVYSLFALTRELIKANEGCTHFATLVVHVLNHKVRPFTALWHRKSLAGALQSADTCFEFRRKLSEIQETLRQLCRLLGHMAGDAYVDIEIADKAIDKPKTPDYWTTLKFGILDTNDSANTENRATATKINSEESKTVQDRREFYTENRNELVQEGQNAFGLAISGGGIRSATFSLGVLQVLARKGVLKQVDFLSTVSGGGYTGAFLSNILNDDKASLKAESNALPFGTETESAPLRHLRNHSKYLIEGGWHTIAHIAWLLTSGLLISLLLISPLLVLAVLVSYFFQTAVPGWFPTWQGREWLANAFWSIFAIALLALPIIHLIGRFGAWARCAEKLLINLLVATGALYVCTSVPLLFEFIQGSVTSQFFLLGSILYPLALLVLTAILAKLNKAMSGMLALLALSGPLLILAAYFYLYGIAIASHELPLHYLGWYFLAAFLYTSFLLNLNFASPHRYYRDRLTRTYLPRTCQPDTGAVLLSKLNSTNKAPYHLISAALNLPGSSKPELRGRKCDFFLFSKHFCGSSISGYFPTKKWEAMDTGLDLGTAIAISGAAAAPNMGALSSARYTFLMALLNVRLGYWARNPAKKPWHRWFAKLPPFGWLSFWRELWGSMDERGNFLNLSDGGHIENLAVYELLRRRCKFIIAVDGEADPNMRFAGLIRMSQLAKIDFGTEIDLNTLPDLRRQANGNSLAHFALFPIQYAKNAHGFLLYIKASLTGNESEFLSAFKAEHPDFPHQSTADQFFDEMQFEAYRALGEHIADDLFRDELVGEWQTETKVNTWFQELALQMLAIPKPIASTTTSE